MDRQEGREKERERNINVWLPLAHPSLGNLAHNPGMCPDWERNPRPFALQARAQSIELHQLGLFSCLFKKDFIYFYGKGGRKRERETSMCGCLSHAHNWGPGPQPTHVTWLGIELVTLWFTDQHSIHWTTPARAIYIFHSLSTHSHCLEH